MKLWRLPREKYAALAKRFQANIRGTSEELRKDPLETEEEWKARIREHFNPSTLPMYIDYVTKWGVVRFVPRRSGAVMVSTDC